MKKICLFLILSLLLFTSSAFASPHLTFGREKLKSTSKTQTDVVKQNGKCYCECSCPTTAAPSTNTPKAATGKGTSGGGGTIKAK